MVCKFAYQVYRNNWCPIGKIYCTGGNECGFNHNHPTCADRIRVMSDEELADFITDKEKGWCTDIGREMYYQRNLEWLKQPVEED